MNNTALATFIARKAEIDKLISALQAASAEHFNVHPDAVDWGHVGNLGYLLERLADGASFITAK